MGGYGSTRWKAHCKKLAVEDCLTLPISIIRDVVGQHSKTTGRWAWEDPLDEPILTADYQLTPITEGELELRLEYKVGGEVFHQYILLKATHPYFGGLRWWFICPLCNGRVGKLYMPPDCRSFACRECFDLTYTSSQENHKYDKLYTLLAVATGSTIKGVRRALREIIIDSARASSMIPYK